MTTPIDPVGQFIYDTMFTKGGTAMYEIIPDAACNIHGHAFDGMFCGCCGEPAEIYFCDGCGCPRNEHDEHGTCHALDFPPLGIANDCICEGLS